MVRGALVKGYSFLLTILICVALVPIWSQTNGGLDRLKSLYKGKVLLLREEVTRRSWTLAGFEITDIEPPAKGVEIAGDRMTIVYAEGKQRIVKLVRFKIDVPHFRPGKDRIGPDLRKGFH